MSIEIRPIPEVEFAAYKRVSTIAFGSAPAELEEPRRDRSFEFDRTRCAFDGDRLVGVSRAITFEVTVPGGSVAASGIADIGVLPTHRRRGVLTAMMAELLDDACARHEPVALLTSSEGGIYGRFGFGVAVQRAEVEVAKPGAVVVAPGDGGSLELIPAAEARDVIVPLFDVARRQTVGDINRHPWWWDARLTPRAGERLPFVVVRRDANGDPDGYAMYGLQWQNDSRRARLEDLVALGPGAYADLWGYLIGIDLVEKVVADHSPVDPAVQWLLADPRHARITHVADLLWARILDVGAAIGARTYGADDELAIGVVDLTRPSNDGTWLLRSKDGASSCERDDRATAALTIDVASLGAAWLGGTSFAALRLAGRVQEHRPGAVARADRLFGVAPAPHCRTHF